MCLVAVIATVTLALDGSVAFLVENGGEISVEADLETSRGLVNCKAKFSVGLPKPATPEPKPEEEGAEKKLDLEALGRTVLTANKYKCFGSRDSSSEKYWKLQVCLYKNVQQVHLPEEIDLGSFSDTVFEDGILRQRDKRGLECQTRPGVFRDTEVKFVCGASLEVRTR